VLEQLPSSRQLAYTSVSTILRILEQKNIVSTRKEGRGHIYIPILQREEFEARAVRHVVDKVFSGTPVGLVRQLLNSGELTQTELEEIQLLISQAELKS
jgi:predicted transcriptional regulator